MAKAFWVLRLSERMPAKRVKVLFTGIELKGMIHEIRLGIKAFSIDGKSLLAFSIILGNAGIKIVPSPKPIKII